MGCDIHLYVEKQIDGAWVAAEKFARDEPEDGEEVGRLDRDYKLSYYSGRNYDLFAILADVRNGSGFAGVRTGGGFSPIAAPRGISDDASPEYKEIAKRWDGDGHSHSFLTLRELLDYDWTQTTSKQGWCGIKDWLQWSGWARGQGQGPEGYCGGVSGGSVEHIGAGEMDALCTEARKLDGAARAAFLGERANHYALAEWTTPYYRAAGEFLSSTVPRLLKLAGGTSGADGVRIAFFFDN